VLDPQNAQWRAAKPIVYQDRVFPDRSTAARYIADELRCYTVPAIGVQLAHHADDVAAVLAYRGRSPARVLEIILSLSYVSSFLLYRC
jgi:hypothetical protein